MNITGKELIGLGVEQERELAQALEYANAQGLSGQALADWAKACKPAAPVRNQMSKFGLAEVVDEIEPSGAIMAGDWERDAPWHVKKRARHTAGVANASSV